MLYRLMTPLVAVLGVSGLSLGVAPPDLDAAVNERLGLHKSEVFEFDLHLAQNGGAAAFIEIDDETHVLAIRPFDVRSDDFQLVVDTGVGLISVAPGATTTYRGELLTVPGSRVAASILPDGVYARILMPGTDEYYLEPVGDRVEGTTPHTHVLYHRADVEATDRGCGNDLFADAALHADAPGESRSDPLAGTAVQITELACDADYEYYLDYGSSVTNVQSRINSVINTMNLQYESEVGITHQITTILVRTNSSQPYTSTNAETLLNQFRNQWNANHGSIQRDVAHLFTGKEVDGGTIGIAWVGVVCNLSYGYGLVQSDFNNNFSCATDLSAHELGHNWNAPHCSCTSYTMNPFITCANQFNPSSTIPTITSFRNSRACLDDGVDPVGACCLPDGTCSIATEADCTGTYLGDGTDCSACVPATGGCCLPDGTCSIATEADCAGTYLGDGTDCSGDPCSNDVTNVASGDLATAAGTINSGSYLDTHTQNDVREVLREEHTGGNPSQRVTLLDHTWTIPVITGTSYSFSIEAHHSANNEGDDFAVSYSLDNSNWTPMLVVTKTSDNDTDQTYAFPEDVSGTVYVRVVDLDRTPGNRRTDSFFVDHMSITSVTDGSDTTPPGAPANLSATGGDGQVALDWDGSSASDLDGYIVYRSTSSGGQYGSITGIIGDSDYLDLAVTNGTTYYYVVTALDLVGNESSASDEATALPQPPGSGPTTMSVSSIVVSTQNIGGGQKRGKAVVTVLDDLGDPVVGATVFGTFSGDLNESVSATTNASGVATLVTVSTRKGGVNITMCVDNVTGNLIYDDGGNVETCDSN